MWDDRKRSVEVLILWVVGRFDSDQQILPTFLCNVKLGATDQERVLVVLEGREIGQAENLSGHRFASLANGPDHEIRLHPISLSRFSFNEGLTKYFLFIQLSSRCLIDTYFIWFYQSKLCLWHLSKGKLSVKEQNLVVDNGELGLRAT